MKIQISSRNSVKILALSSSSHGYSTCCKEYRVNSTSLRCSPLALSRELEIYDFLCNRNVVHSGTAEEIQNILVCSWVKKHYNLKLYRRHEVKYDLLPLYLHYQMKLSTSVPPPPSLVGGHLSDHGHITETLYCSFRFPIFNFC